MSRLFSFLISITLFAAPTLAAWTPWVSLGGGIIGDPAACTGAGQTYVVAKGTDYAMWYRKRTLSTGIWDAWKRIPGTRQFTGSPSVACRVYRGEGYFAAYAVGFDGQLYISYYGGLNNFTPWTRQPLTGIPTGRLASGSGLSTPSLPDYDLMPQLFARASDRSTYWSICPQGSCYSRWNLITGIVNSDPAAAYQSPSRIDFVVQATNGYLYHAVQGGLIWNPFVQITGSPVTSAPDIVSRYQGSLDLFARGPNRTLLHKLWINGVWGNWEDLGGVLTSGPGATTYASNARIMVFVRGTDGALWYRAWAP